MKKRRRAGYEAEAAVREALWQHESGKAASGRPASPSRCRDVEAVSAIALGWPAFLPKPHGWPPTWPNVPEDHDRAV